MGGVVDKGSIFGGRRYTFFGQKIKSFDAEHPSLQHTLRTE
jgi:hypothetical protein